MVEREFPSGINRVGRSVIAKHGGFGDTTIGEVFPDIGAWKADWWKTLDREPNFASFESFRPPGGWDLPEPPATAT